MKILIVDDEQMIAEILKETLEDEGHQADMVFSGNKAIATLKDSIYDIIISDIRMPDGDGLVVAEYIKAMDKQPYLIFITGQSNYSTEELIGAGASYIISKPLDFDHLIQHIESLG